MNDTLLLLDDNKFKFQIIVKSYPANMRRWSNIGLRRWHNSKPTLGQRLMFAGWVLGKY